jgi:hypothetical protein
MNSPLSRRLRLPCPPILVGPTFMPTTTDDCSS